MRNIYSKEFEFVMRAQAPTHYFKDLVKLANKFYPMTSRKLMLYLSKRHIRYKDYNENRCRKMNGCEIGTEYIKPDGMILVKCEDGWEYKQRLIYEQYYNIALPTSTMVIFLDGDRNNFNISNLMAVETREYNCAKNKHLISNNKEITKTALLSARLHYKSKEKNK